MEHPLQPLERDLDALRHAWTGSLSAFGALEGDAQLEVEQMLDGGLVRVTDLLAQVRRDADALLARVSAEVAKRSGSEFGDQGLAKAHGFHTPARLIAASTGSSRHEAARLIAVGTATAARPTFGGERLPSPHPHVAAALRAADISVDAASAITSMLDRVAVRADPRQSDVAESVLVGLATRVPLETVMHGVREAEARLDHDGIEPAKKNFVRGAHSRCVKTATASCTSPRTSTPRPQRP